MTRHPLPPGLAWRVCWQVRWLPGKGFSVFHSQRWLGASQQPASAVAASCSLGSSGGGGGGPGHTLVLVGPGGSSTLISTKATTLYEKAKLLQAAKSPRHDRYGYVAACGLEPYSLASPPPPLPKSAIASTSILPFDAFFHSSPFTPRPCDRLEDAWRSLQLCAA